MTIGELKELKKALWEVEMKKQKKDIPFLDELDIVEILREQRETGGKINLSPDAWEFYKEDFHKVMKMFEDEEQKELQQKVLEFREQVEKDKETAVQVMLKQNANVPWQVRKTEEQIRQDVKMAVGNPGAFDMNYRKRLAQLCGGELKEDGNTVQLDERVLNERLIQKNFDKQQAEKKERSNLKAEEQAEINKKPIF